MYYLYFIKDGEPRLYGSGNKNYMRELINDYVILHEMYDNDEVTFRITRTLINKKNKE